MIEEDLPHIRLCVISSVFRAEGETHDGIDWSIYAEVEAYTSARCKVKVGGRAVADITVHSSNSEETLIEEAQLVCAALVWSAIRSIRLNRTVDVAEDNPSTGDLSAIELALSAIELAKKKKLDLFFQKGLVCEIMNRIESKLNIVTQGRGVANRLVIGRRFEVLEYVEGAVAAEVRDYEQSDTPIGDRSSGKIVGEIADRALSVFDTHRSKIAPPYTRQTKLDTHSTPDDYAAARIHLSRFGLR